MLCYVHIIKLLIPINCLYYSPRMGDIHVELTVQKVCYTGSLL